MVSSSHEAMHRIFQEDPGIFARTFDRLGIPFTEPVAVSLLPTDLTEIKPLERRLDTLLQVETADGGSYLLAVEAQGRKDPDKHCSWAYYLSYLYAKYRMPPLLLVVCQDEATAQWAKMPFHLGTPMWRTLTLRPLVLGPHNVPIVADVASAAEDIPVAVFSVLTHSRHPHADTMLRALSAALRKADPDTADLFKEITELGLGTSPAAEIWRDLMAIPTSFFRSETAEKVREEGRVQSRAEDTLTALQLRGIEVSDDVRERVESCTDSDLVRLWFHRAVTAERAEDIFGD
ncbi:hypothetical protein [Streptomyces sp. NPDC020917]|uniref:hypothetical protein n=1 Tax=Streptomyces sp. NPDC020917 TaxID=3365102 RepID=UPI0037960F4B